MLILVAVTISMAVNGGLFEYASNAGTQTNAAVDAEQEFANLEADMTVDKLISKYIGENGQDGNNSTPTTMEEAQANTMLTKKVNSDVTDKYNNKITVPAGFKILVDGTTGYTAETIDVTKGIVITDGTNEFVWVPVGTIYTDEEKTPEKTKTIKLSRYTFEDNGKPIVQQDVAINDDNNGCFQELATSNYGNITAKSLSGFIDSATKKCGYYIGRYEAGNLNDTLVCKANQTIYDNVTQSQASSLSQSMYAENANFTSDLVNSYAWDTAIVFIQTFSTEEDANNYANLNKSENYANTGINVDKYCNIHDMSGNAYEWSTENYYHSVMNLAPCVLRGGRASAPEEPKQHCANTRGGSSSDRRLLMGSFRPILFVAI